MFVHALELFALGLVASVVGSLAGLGGGFLLTPALRIFFKLPPAEASGLSLVLVMANVTGASIAFLRQGRIDLKLVTVMGLCALPGSVLGAIAVRYAAPVGFDAFYAALLGVLSFDMFRRKGGAFSGRLARHLPWGHPRTIFDRASNGELTYTVSWPMAGLLGAVAGFASSFLGIGGGVIVVPSLLNFFAMPVHFVSATSSSVILYSAPVGIATHGLRGDIDWPLTPALVVAGLIGGQTGATISRHIPGGVLTKVIGVALGLAALGLIVSHLL